MQTQTSNTLHNAIIEDDSKDRPPMLAPGNYVQWKSIIKRYIYTKPNHELIHYCFENPPHKLTWAYKEVPVSEGNPKTRSEKYMETYKNVSQDIRDQLNAKGEAVQIILTWIDNDIYSTVDACPNRDDTDDELEDQELEAYYIYMAKLQKVFPDATDDTEPVQEDKGIAKSELKKLTEKLKGNSVDTKEKMILYEHEEARIYLNAEQSDWRNDTDDDELEDQELEAHYMYMAKLQEASILDTYPIEQDAYNVIIDSLDMSYDKEEID
nr:hypothetical protein [Tanacetum cinerariifolium]